MVATDRSLALEPCETGMDIELNEGCEPTEAWEPTPLATLLARVALHWSGFFVWIQN